MEIQMEILLYILLWHSIIAQRLNMKACVLTMVRKMGRKTEEVAMPHVMLVKMQTTSIQMMTSATLGRSPSTISRSPSQADSPDLCERNDHEIISVTVDIAPTAYLQWPVDTITYYTIHILPVTM